MSADNRIIEGVGVRMNDIPLNQTKCRNELAAHYKECGKKDVVADITSEDIEAAEFWFKTSFYGIADFISQITDDFVFGTDDGEGNEYLYICPVLPWEVTDNMPKNLTEAHDSLYRVIKKVSDISREEFEGLVDDDLFVLCCN